MWRFCDLPSSVWESVASGVPRAGLVQVAVAESDAAFSDPRTATQLGLERIGTNPAQHTEGRGEPAGRGPSPSRAGARGICGPGRTGCAPPEALPARRKQRERAGAVGACSVNAEDPRSRTGRGCDEVCQEKAKRAGPLTVRCRCRAQLDPSGPPQGSAHSASYMTDGCVPSACNFSDGSM